jgi:hypothetical protein
LLDNIVDIDACRIDIEQLLTARVRDPAGAKPAHARKEAVS